MSEYVEYDYMKSLKEDISQYINENAADLRGMSTEDVYEKLNDDLWTEDSVTGNASGSYTFSRYKARAYVTGCDSSGDDNLDIVRDAINDGFMNKEQFADWVLEDDWESIDVSIRCYLLGQAIDSVLDDMDPEFFEEEDDSDDDGATFEGVTA